MRKLAWILSALLLGGTAMAADFTGTWKLNLEKSPGTRLASGTIKLEQIGPNAYRTTVDNVSKSGKTTHSEMNRVYDAQERHVNGDGLTDQGTEICEITSDGTRKVTMKENGKVVEVISATISADGKTMTHTVTDDKGVQHVAIYDRQ
jgi:hypothetical protein